jgi:hypothetical protein
MRFSQPARTGRALVVLLASVCGVGVRSASAGGDGPAAPAVAVRYYGAFAEVPPRDIAPQGWLREMLQRQVDGLASHHAVSGYPFDTCLWAGHIPRDANPKSKAWWPYEQAGYLVDGLERLGQLSGDPAIRREADANVAYILSHPAANGSLGPDDIGPNKWPDAVVFRALLANFAATADPAIPQALRRHYLTLPTGFGVARDACNIEEMLWTYAHTGDPALLAQAAHTYEVFNAARPKTSMAALASDKEILEHGVTFNETAKLPALLYLYTGDRALLEATTNAYRKIDRDHMLADGLHSAEERLAGNSPWRYHETCNISDYTWSVGYLLMASGDATWADHIEKAIFNAGFGSITKDFKAHQYFSAPNQVVAAPGICPRYDPDRQAYRPGHDVECCSGNVHRFLPNFALRQWLTTAGGGIVAALYAPTRFSTRVNGSDVTIDEQTDYPFSEVIRFVVHASTPEPMSLYLRVPGWTEKPQLDVNGTALALTAPGTFAPVQRTFADGDVLTLHLPMPLRIVHWAGNTASIERGPLVYALQINAIATPLQGSKTAPGFPAWDMQPGSPWNYGLALSGPTDASQIAVVQTAGQGFPWDTGQTPIHLQVPVRAISNWTLPANHHNPEFPAAPDFSGDVHRVSFVPYGSSCLRLTVLPLSMQ